MALVDFADVSHIAFDEADSAGVANLCRLLAERISRMFRTSTESWQTTAFTAIESLRSVGHDLWSFDDDGDGWQTWCGDYSRPVPAPAELTLEFRAPDRVEVTWLRGNPKTVVADAIAGSNVIRTLANKPLKQTAAPRRDCDACLSPVVKYHGLARRYLPPPRFLMRPLLNGGTLGGRRCLAT